VTTSTKINDTLFVDRNYKIKTHVNNDMSILIIMMIVLLFSAEERQEERGKRTSYLKVLTIATLSTIAGSGRHTDSETKKFLFFQ